MRVCPQCKERYDDDSLERCPEDDTPLLLEGAPNNPRLMEVIPVDEAAETRMFAAADVQEELSRADEGPPRAAPTLPDVGATTPLSREELEEAMREAQALQEKARGGRIEPTDVVKDRARRDQEPQPASGRAGLIAALTVAGIMLVAMVIALAFVFWPKPTYLKITSTPASARVEIDGMLSGEAPINAEVEPGSHSVTLSLDGFHPFAQVVEVPKEGRILAVALVENKPEPQTPADDEVDATLKARTEAIFQEVDALIEVGDFDAADSRLQVLAALVPSDERVTAALDQVRSARENPADAKDGEPGDGKDKPKSQTVVAKGDDLKPVNLSRKEREREADRLHREGQELYKKGKFADAKEVLLKAIRFDSRFYPPHRVLARVYNREKNVSKAKYHLTRYIELGGSDDDYKIRQWLATH